MNKLIKQIIFLIIIASGFSLPQWSTDPNNNLIIGYGQDPKICSDSAGGCYVTYNYETTFYPQKLAVERLDKYGYKPWGTLKQILGELPEQWQAEIIADGERGVIVSYQDNEWIPPSYFNSKVRVQKVDSIGNFLWGQTGVRVSLEATNHSGQNLVSDGDGGCVIAWADWDGEFSVNRINRFGDRVWGDTGIVLAPTGTSLNIVRASDGKYYVQVDTNVFRINQNGEIINQYSTTLGQMVPDPEGGIVLSNKVWTGMIPKLVSQRKDSLGNNRWQEPYVEIADSLYINSPINVKKINGYYYYCWYGRKNGIDLVTQYQALRSDGTKLFNQDNLPISNYPVDALFGNILPSESGTIVLVWQDYRPEDGVFGQRRDTLGNPFWNLNDVPLYTGIYSELYAITDCAGGAIGLGWHQFDFSIRAFKVSKNGILGEVITNLDMEEQLIFPEEIILYPNYPNPFNSSTIIRFQLPKENKINIGLYNILGEKIQTIVDGFYSKGTHSFNFSSGDLTSGIYLYKLQTDIKSTTKKLIIIK